MVFTVGTDCVLCEVPTEAKKQRTSLISPFTSQEQEIRYLIIYETLKEIFSVQVRSTGSTTHGLSLTGRVQEMKQNWRGRRTRRISSRCLKLHGVCVCGSENATSACVHFPKIPLSGSNWWP